MMMMMTMMMMMMKMMIMMMRARMLKKRSKAIRRRPASVSPLTLLTDFMLLYSLLCCFFVVCFLSLMLWHSFNILASAQCFGNLMIFQLLHNVLVFLKCSSDILASSQCCAVLKMFFRAPRRWWPIVNQLLPKLLVLVRPTP